MGDSWDDDEFEVPTIAAKPPAANWDDEEDNVVVDEDIVAKPSASQVAAQKKKADEEELTFQTKMKLSLLENETPDQKKMRERRQLEEADAELSSDLFTKTKKAPVSLSAAGGIGSTVLKTIGDHSTFGKTIAAKLKDSSAFNVGAFYKSLNKVLDREISLEVIEEIYQTVSRIRDAKLKEKPAGPPVVKKKSKKDLAKEKQDHDDKFGGSAKEYNDEYDNMEDNYM
jgi:hypothetical protein